METVVFVLICFLVIQQAFYMLCIHKLINKLMSKDYYSYVLSEKQKNEAPKSQGVKVDLEPQDDLGVMASIL